MKLFYVENRKKTTLFSDKFSSYLNLKKEESYLDPYGYYHFWVNHSKEFVDRYQSFIHTNGIERSWRCVRNQISSIKRTFRPKLVQEYLDVFMIKNTKTAQEFYQFMIQVIVQLNIQSNYDEEIAET